MTKTIAQYAREEAEADTHVAHVAMRLWLAAEAECSPGEKPSADAIYMHPELVEARAAYERARARRLRAQRRAAAN